MVNQAMAELTRCGFVDAKAASQILTQEGFMRWAAGDRLRAKDFKR